LAKAKETGIFASPGAVGKVACIIHQDIAGAIVGVMASDGRCGGKPSFQGFSMTLNVSDVAEAERVFAALSDQGEVQIALTKTFWSPGFEMITDRFGLPWLIIAQALP